MYSAYIVVHTYMYKYILNESNKSLALPVTFRLYFNKAFKSSVLRH